MANYWLHRISHEKDVSYDLLDQGYLTIGWSMLIGPEVLDAIESGSDAYRVFTNKRGITTRSKWNLWYFAQMEPGDVVLVPRDGGEYGIYEIKEKARPITDLAPKKFKTRDKKAIEITGEGLWNQTDHIEVDLGFFITVEKQVISKRHDASPKLIARMKMFQATANVNDLKEEIEEAKRAKGPRDFRSEMLAVVVDAFENEGVYSRCTPDEMELLVKFYFEKIGATDVTIPAKNDPSKKEGKDVDVIAAFEDLDVLFYVQVKHHEGLSGTEAVQQLIDYEKFGYNPEDGVTRIPWALTSAKFSEEAKKLAEEHHIRLIEGREFSKMLLKAGMGDVGING